MGQIEGANNATSAIHREGADDGIKGPAKEAKDWPGKRWSLGLSLKREANDGPLGCSLGAPVIVDGPRGQKQGLGPSLERKANDKSVGRA